MDWLFYIIFGVVLLFVIIIAMRHDKTGWGMFRSFSPARFHCYQRIKYRQKKAGRKTVND